MITEIKTEVAKILHLIPEARDSDRVLWVALITKSEGWDVLNSMNTLEFLKNLTKERYPHFESVRRCRQLLQASHPELRGERYKERQEQLEPSVRDEIKADKGQASMFDNFGQ